jgi:hypothetical protein
VRGTWKGGSFAGDLRYVKEDSGNGTSISM